MEAPIKLYSTIHTSTLYQVVNMLSILLLANLKCSLEETSQFFESTD